MRLGLNVILVLEENDSLRRYLLKQSKRLMAQ